MALAFDPNPWGCPIGLRVRPSDMPDTLTAVCVKLRDLLHASIFVINPSKGKPYPILYLYADEGDTRPRVVWFPGWENDRRSSKRRIDYKRQTTLLQRIADAGVAGESLEDYRGHPSDNQGPGPLLLPLAVPATGMDTVIRDLFDSLGDLLRVTVTAVDQGDAPELRVVRIYSLAEEKKPRLILFPGWFGTVESPLAEIDRARMDELLAEIKDKRLKELPVEAFFA